MGLTAWVNGEFVPLDEARVSIQDRGFLYGDGLFETLYARNGNIFRLEDHLDRLYSGALNLNIPLPMSQGEIGILARETLSKNQLNEAVVRIQLTRGEGPPGLIFPENVKPSLVIQIRPHLRLPQELRSKGVSVCTANQSSSTIGILNEQVKSCNFLMSILVQNEARKTGFYEAVYMDERNHLAEGTVTNLFLIKEGVVRTPPLGNRVLNGITRKVILEACEKDCIKCLQEPVSLQSALEADELFISNSGIGVLPVVRVNYEVVSEGIPGPITRKLAEAYFKTVDRELGSC